MTEKKDPPETEEPPANQSPETLEEEPGLSREDVEAMIEEKTKDLREVPPAQPKEEAPPPKSDDDGTKGGDGPKEPSPPSPPASSDRDVRDVVRDVLKGDEHDKEHQRIASATAERPKPKRGWVAEILLGKRD